jgi:hypothetical protein
MILSNRRAAVNENKNDQPIRELDENLEPEPPISPPDDNSQPGVVAGVGSSALGSVDLEPEEDEPQTRRHPDNDGETVEG